MCWHRKAGSSLAWPIPASTPWAPPYGWWRLAGASPTVWRKVSRYRELFQGSDSWRIAPDERVQTQTYHRPLSWYIHTLPAAGLVVTAFEELEPKEEFFTRDDEGPWIAEIPLHYVLGALKLGKGFSLR